MLHCTAAPYALPCISDLRQKGCKPPYIPVGESYEVAFIANAIGHPYGVSVQANYPLIANAVMEVDEFLAAIDASAAKQGVQPGDEVRGADHDEIGAVERVVETTDDAQGHLVVSRGVIFEREMFVPLDAVVKRAGTTVFINVPKLIIGKMTWDAVPSQVDSEAKIGPPAATLEKLYGSPSSSKWERPAE